MKNFVANGASLQIVAPVGGVVGGQLYKQGSIIGVVVADAAEGVAFTLKIEGAYNTVPKTAGAAWAVGDMLYFETSGNTLTKTVGSNTFAGYAYEAAGSADVVGSVLLSH